MMPLKTAISAMLLLAAAAQNAPAQAAPQTQSTPQAPGRQEAAASSISLSPAVVTAHGEFGKTMSQKLTMTNPANTEMSFAVEAYDAIVKDGKRAFVPAGETAHSAAATAVFSPKTVIVKPHSSATVEIHVTVPAESQVRAIRATFREKGRNAAGDAAPLSALMTFKLTDNIKIEPAEVRVFPARETGNLNVALWMTNTGSEPVAPEGVVEMLDAAGKPAAKTAFPSLHLLPGEKLDFAAEFTELPPPGNYKVLCSFQFEGKTLTKESTFSVM